MPKKMEVEEELDELDLLNFPRLSRPKGREIMTISL